METGSKPLAESRLEASVRMVTRALAAVGITLLLANVTIQMIDIFCRWFFSAPQAWVTDIYELTLPIAIAACFPLPLNERGMIAIEFLGQAVGPKIARLLDLFGAILLFLLFAAITWQLWQHATTVAANGNTTWMLGISMAPTWFLVTLLLALSTLVQLPLLANLCRRVARAWNS